MSRTGVRFAFQMEGDTSLNATSLRRATFHAGVVSDSLGCESSWVSCDCQDALVGRDTILGIFPIS